MKKYYFFALMALGAISCQQEIEVLSVDEPVNFSIQASPYAISEEQALTRLEEFMSAFDGDQTRSHRWSVKEVRSISYSDIYGQTRSSDSENVDELFYIVEFGEGKGSAVMGADVRLESVYAVLDETVLTIENFNDAVNGENLDDVTTYTAGLIAQNAMNRISTCDLIIDDFRTDVTYYTTTNTVLTHVEPMLNTKWGQYSPFNDKFPLKESGEGREEAGCGTIAVAQVLTYLTYPNNLTLNGHSHDWSIISMFTYWANPITNIYYNNCLSQFIYDLAIEMGVEYEDDSGEDLGSAVPVENSEALFRDLGYLNVNFETLTAAKAKNMIWNNKPFYAYGIDTHHTVVPSDEAHAWVIDGWKEIRTVIREIVEDNGIIISNRISQTYDTQYVHFNFGWSGICDGYYTFTNFDTRYRLPNDMIEEDYGDRGGVAGWDFSHDINMIKYNY